MVHQKLNIKKSFPVKLKICGMGTPENIRSMELLEPDYLGFIFYEGSQRYFTHDIPEISEKIKKTGVFVNASEEFIAEKTLKYKLDAIQLHGEETPEFCTNLKIQIQKITSDTAIEIIKVFSVKAEFDFSKLKDYEGIVDYFLFDTQGKNKGGNGILFNWDILKDYPSSTPFFLSGGIGLEEVESLRKLKEYFQKNGKSKVFYAIDVNSKFEISPGEKNKNLLEKFKIELAKGLQ